MPLTFQQTDTAVTADQKCSARAATGMSAREGTVGGVPGVGTQNTNNQNSGTHLSKIGLDLNVPAGAVWGAGNYIIDLNITIGNSNLTIKEAYVCRINSAGANQATIGSNLAVNIVASTGVKSITVSGAAQTPAVGDRIYVVLTVENVSGSMNQQFTWSPSETVQTPLSVTLTADAPIAQFTLSGVVSAVAKSTVLPVASLSLFGNTPITIKSLDSSVAQFLLEANEPSIPLDANAPVANMTLFGNEPTPPLVADAEIAQILLTGNEPTFWKKIAELPATSISFTDEFLEGSTQYCYFITGANSEGDSEPSNIICSTTDPGQFTTMPRGTITFSGNTPTGSATYDAPIASTSLLGNEPTVPVDVPPAAIVVSGNEPTFWKKIAELAASSISYTDTGLAPGEYCYFVTGENVTGESEPSNISCATVAGGQTHELPIVTMVISPVLPVVEKVNYVGSFF